MEELIFLKFGYFSEMFIKLSTIQYIQMQSKSDYLIGTLRKYQESFYRFTANIYFLKHFNC